MKKIIETLKYKFDNIMSKGTISLVWMLFLVTALVITLLGIAARLVNGGTLRENIWAGVMHTIDAGTITGTETANLGFLIVMCLVTLSGLFITSILIGIITTGFEEKLNQLKKGNSKVIEKNHTLILGFNESIYTILNELIIANENKKKASIVILAKEDKEEVETAIKEQIQDFKTTKIIIRTGSITDNFMLGQCMAEYSKSIIINNEEDFLTIKSILAINNYLKETSTNNKPYIVTTINDKENYEVATIAAEGNAEIILEKESISKIIAQTCRQPGLSNVLIELFDYDGNELYFETFEELEGKSFKETLLSFEQAIVFGYKRDNQIYINPPHSTIMKKTDELILLVEDDNVANIVDYNKNIDIKKYISNNKKTIEIDNTLILGTNDKLTRILEEIDEYYIKGSKITLANTSINEKEYITNKYNNITLEFKECDITKRNILNNLVTSDTKQVLLLSDDNTDAEISDSLTLMKLIHLRDITKVRNLSFPITSEMKQIVNQKLAKVAKVNDLVVGSNIINLIITQISENRDLSEVFKILLTSEGSEIYTRKITDYIKVEKEIDFYTLTEIASLKNEVAIGYKIGTGNDFSIIVNPIKSELINFNENDELIVLSLD